MFAAYTTRFLAICRASETDFAARVLVLAGRLVKEKSLGGRGLSRTSSPFLFFCIIRITTRGLALGWC
jgi:hypothetical protein